MRRLETVLPGGRALVAIDVVLTLWAAVWIITGIVVARELHGLTELSDTVGTVGRATETSGEALASIEDLPVIGDVGLPLDAPAVEIQEAGRSAQQSGASSRESVETVSILLGLSIALIPSVPPIAVYLPGRIARFREVRAIGAARRRAGSDPSFAEFLARRAAHNLTYRQLDRVTDEPWRDLEAGRFDRLARAELERLGLRGPVSRRTP